MRPHDIFWSSSITPLVLGIAPLGFFTQTPSFAHPPFQDSTDAVTGHSYLLHTLCVFVCKRGVISMQNIPSQSALSPDCLSSSVSNLMRRHPIHLPLPASGALRSPHIYSANRIRSDRRLRHIRCYKVCSNHRGL